MKKEIKEGRFIAQTTKIEYSLYENNEEASIREAGGRAAFEIAGVPLDPYQNFQAREPITQREASPIGYDAAAPYENGPIF